MQRKISTQLARWGGSLAVRIPKPLLEAAQMHEGDRVALSVEEGTITIRQAAKATLAELVNAITSENRHEETDWGEPGGNEAW